MNTATSLQLPPGTLAGDSGTVLIIHSEQHPPDLLAQYLLDNDFDILTAKDVETSLELFRANSVRMVFIDADMLANDACDIVGQIKSFNSDNFIPVIAIVPQGEAAILARCADAGVDDYLETPFSSAALQIRIAAMQELRELQLSYKNSIEEQVVGKRILSTALSARTLEIEPVRKLSRSAAVFSGDLTLMARQPDGKLHVLLADFTGHGLSAAIGVLPVADTFSVMTEKGFEPDVIIQQINNKLHTLLPTGMFMAVSLLQLDSELHYANVWNAGMPDIYVIDYVSGHIRERIGSGCLPLGISENLENINKTHVDVKLGDQFILHSDGLTDSVNADGEMFGIERFEQILNHANKTDSVFDRVVQELDAFCGDTPLVDDVSIVCVPCVHEVVQPVVNNNIMSKHVTHDYNGSWRWMMELSGASLHDVDPVPVVINEYNKLTAQPVSMMKLHNVLTELYRNALEYGVFRSVRKQMERTHRCNRDEITNANLFDGSYIKIELQQIRYRNLPAMLIRVEDSGRGFDHESVMRDVMDRQNDVAIGYGLKLVMETCESLVFNRCGNTVEAIIADRQLRGCDT